MKKIITALNIIIAIYFFGLANFFFWSSVLGVLIKVFGKEELTMGNFWAFIVGIIFAPFLIYGTIIFFQKTKGKYLYGLIILGIIWIETQVHRLLFITQGKLEKTDLLNILFFGIPFIVILFVKYLDKKLSK